MYTSPLITYRGGPIQAAQLVKVGLCWIKLRSTAEGGKQNNFGSRGISENITQRMQATEINIITWACLCWLDLENFPAIPHTSSSVDRWLTGSVLITEHHDIFTAYRPKSKQRVVDLSQPSQPARFRILYSSPENLIKHTYQLLTLHDSLRHITDKVKVKAQYS